MSETLETQREGRVLVVRFENPPHNLMNRGVVKELDSLTRSLEGDRSVGSVVITGKPDDLFITHYDVAEIVAGVREVGLAPRPAVAAALLRLAGAIKRVPGLREAAARTPARGLLELHLLHDVFVRMNRMDKVFIAAINGPAVGGGCELALACDLRYMADRQIALGLPEMTMGFNPGAGGTQRLSRLLGQGRALEMMLEGRTLSPSEAERVGLVHRAVEPSELLAHSIESGRRLARRSPEAIRGVKRSVYEGASGGLGRGLAAERKWFLSEAGTEQAIDAMDAFVKEFDARGGSPWTDPEAIRRWQEGTAAD